MTYIWPWPKGTEISQQFGTNPGGVNPAGGHTGIDAGLPVGTPLRAPADGVIEWANWFTDPTGADNRWLMTDGGGISVVLNCGTGKPNFNFSHLSRTALNIGDKVRQGDIIGYSGNTGRWTTGPHCHFEAMPDGWDLGSNTYGRVNPGIYCNMFWEDLVAAKAAAAALKPNERRAGKSPVNQRKEPKLNSPVVRVIPAGSKEVFTGYKRGDMVTVGAAKSNLWLVDDKGAASVLFFDPTNVTGLKDLTPAAEAPHQAPKPAPAPTPHAAPAPAPPAQRPVPVQPPSEVLHGVDVSSHNVGVNLLNIAGDFVLVKATEGVGFTDPALAAHAASAASGGRLRGFYHFARPGAQEGNTAAAEAKWFVKTIRPLMKSGDLLILDWEAENQGDTAWALEWLRGVRTMTGAQPLIYMSMAAVNAHDWSAVEAEFGLWMAAYSKGSTRIDGFHPELAGDKIPVTWAKGYRMWQYTSAGRLAGWGADLDLNVWYGTRADWIALGVPPMPVPGIPVPVDDLGTLQRFAAWLIDLFLKRAK
jgi:GH25 family lysozyme M1 (1,4-beta-N-acetylmuramidase)